MAKAKKNTGAPKKAAAPAFTALAKRVAAIDWDEISLGQGKGFAEAFAQLGSPKTSLKALAAIRKLFVRRDDLVYPIAGLAMPFLVERIGMPDAGERAALLVLCVDMAIWNHGRWIECGFDPKTTAVDFMGGRSRARNYNAFAAGAPTYIALLDDPDPVVRAAGAFALAWIPSPPTDRLVAAFDREPDPIARASTALSLGTTARSAANRSALAARLVSKLDAEHPIERLAVAIACSLIPDVSSDPRVVSILRATTTETSKALPWCSGKLQALAQGRLLPAVFGPVPDAPPSAPPTLTNEQRAALRAMIDAGLPDPVREVLASYGFPVKETALRRFAGSPRAIPEGKHAAIYDRWMTWAETGQPDASKVAAELAAEVPLADTITVIELMYYAEQENDEDLADWPLPELPDPVSVECDDYNEPHDLYRWYRRTVDDCVRSYEPIARAAGYTTWSHGHDGNNDLDQGNVVAWHPEGREIHVGFDLDTKRGLVHAHYEFNRTLVRTFTEAAMDRHGAPAVLAALRKHPLDGMRQAIGLLRVGWAIADRMGTIDPICDELAHAAGTNRHYIYWITRAHIERVDEKRREALVLRLVGPENDDTVFGWVRFAPTPAVRKAATKMIPRTFGTSYYDLDGANATADEMMPFVDDSLVPTLVKAVKADSNPTMQVILLGRMGRLDAIKIALKSEYPMAREAAKRALAAK